MAVVRNLMIRCGADFSGVKRATEQAKSGLQAMGDSVERAGAAIQSIEQKMEALRNKKMPTDDFKSMQAELDKAYASLFKLYDKRDKMEAIGATASSWKSLNYDIETAEASVARLERGMQAMEANGMAWTTGASTSEYSKLAAELEVAKERMAELKAEADKSDSVFGRIRAKTSEIRDNLADSRTQSRDLSKGFKDTLSAVKRIAPALLMARGVMGILRKGVSAYMDENRQLAEQLQGVWVGLGNLLGPIISWLVNLIRDAMGYLLAFLRLFGVTSTQTANQMNKAGGSAKKATAELKRQIMGFDELNILNDQNKDNGGGGGGGGAGYAPIQEKQLPPWLEKFGKWAAEGERLKVILAGMAGVVTALALGVGLLDAVLAGFGVASIMEIIKCIKGWREEGELSKENFKELAVAVAVLGGVLAVFVSPWALVVSAVAIGVLAIIAYWDDIKEYLEPFKKKWDEVFDKMGKKFDDWGNKIKQKWADIKAWWSGLSLDGFRIRFPKLSLSYDVADSAVARFFGVTQIPRISVSWAEAFANGGFPNAGQLFIAREAGAEMVGAMGHKTTVANNDQIVAGIQGGVERANEETNYILRQCVSLLGGILDKDSIVSIDGRSLSESVSRYQRQMGRANG